MEDYEFTAALQRCALTAIESREAKERAASAEQRHGQESDVAWTEAHRRGYDRRQFQAEVHERIARIYKVGTPKGGIVRPVGKGGIDVPPKKLVTRLTCMAVEGGPTDCCGCFNGYWCDWEGGFYSFECNECGRQSFVGSAVPDPAAPAAGEGE
jgi:hypothetical protein